MTPQTVSVVLTWLLLVQTNKVLSLGSNIVTLRHQVPHDQLLLDKRTVLMLPIMAEGEFVKMLNYTFNLEIKSVIKYDWTARVFGTCFSHSG